MIEAAEEVNHLRRFLVELVFKNSVDIIVFNGNMPDRKLAKNSTCHVRSKHIAIKSYFIREALENKSLKMQYLPTNGMPVDILTEELSKPKHEHCIQILGWKNATCAQIEVGNKFCISIR